MPFLYTIRNTSYVTPKTQNKQYTMQQTNTSEKGFETLITDYLVTQNQYVLRQNKDYDNVACLDTAMLFEFLEATQPKEVAKLKQHHKDLYERKIINRLNDQIQAKGIIEVLRKGITEGNTGIKLHLFFDKPVSTYYDVVYQWLTDCDDGVEKRIDQANRTTRHQTIQGRPRPQ
jgi:hypothetical protein